MAAAELYKKLQQKLPGGDHSPLYRYSIALLLTLLASAFNTLFHTRISPVNLVMPYLLVVVISATYLGRGPAILVSILSVLLFDFFFVPPYLTLAVSDTEYLLTFFGLLGVGLVISELTARVRAQVEIARRRSEDTAALYGLSRDLAAAGNLTDIVGAIDRNVSQNFNRAVVILLPSAEDRETLEPSIQNPLVKFDGFEEVAHWVFTHGQAAGRGTDQYPAANARYLPLISSRGIVGVLAARPARGNSSLTPEQARLLEAFASQAALAIERVQLGEQARQAQLLQETERLQSALLNSISHDLRTPLVSITGALSSLREDGDRLPGETRQNLVETAHEEAGRLNRLVGNLLNMTRIEARALQVIWEPCDVQDLVGTALQQLGNRLGEHPIQVEIPEDLPLVAMDFVLMEQVLVNLIDNAVKYSSSTAPIEIHARIDHNVLVLQVLDFGLGIPPDDLPYIFDKFYRVKQPKRVSGTGLGLAICKGIVDAHNGGIQAENRPGGGSIFTVWLPEDGGKKP